MSEEPPSSELPAAWERAFARLSRIINIGWWLDGLAIPMVVLGVAGGGVLLLVRRYVPELGWGQLGLWVVVALLVAAVIGWFLVRRRFETPEQTMVRVESAMRMRNGLSAARAGVTPWPEMPKQLDAGLQWNWRRVVVPPVASLGLLACGLWLPVSAVVEPDGVKHDEPMAWSQIEADLERLGRDELIDETQLEEIRKKLEELREQDEEEWYSHSSLEATDSLREQFASDISRLERELRKADRALGEMERRDGKITEAQKQSLMNQFDEAMQGLENGALKPNPELLNQLRQLDPENLGQLNPEQMKQLRENLQKAGQAAGEAAEGQGQGQGEEWLDELLDGEGDGANGENQPGNGGRGGVDRGPADPAGGVLGKESEPLETGELEALEAKDLSRARPGDLLQVQDGKHQIDETPTGVSEGGAIEGAGAGGDRVWRDRLDPSEQRALKKFFE